MKYLFLLIGLLIGVGASGQVLYESNTSLSLGAYAQNGYPSRLGQSFTIGTTGTNESFVIDSIAFQFNRGANYPMYFNIYAVSGDYPTGASITSGTIPADGSAVQWQGVEVSTAVLNLGTKYVLILYSLNVADNLIQTLTGTGYSGGTAIYYDGTSWATLTGEDFGFQIWGKRTPIITTQPQNITQCIGTNAVFSVVVDTDNPTYQWYRNGVAITGATSSTYTITNIYPGNEATYSVRTTESSLGTYVISSGATLTVTLTPQITVQPVSLSQCYGTTANFSVTATGTSLTYQWQKDNVDVSGATNSTYARVGIASGDEGNYSVVVTGTCGSTESGLANLNVILDPAITAQPVSLTRCEDYSATFTVTATGDEITYQWQKNSSNITGATSRTYIIPAVAVTDEGSYSVIVSGPCNSVESNSVTLTMATSGGPSTLADGLLAAWKFDEVSGSTMSEEIGTNDFTLTGALGNQTGKFGKAVIFDGTGDYGTAPDHASLQMGTNDFSFFAWVYCTGYTDNGTEIYIIGAEDAGFGLGIVSATGQLMAFQVYSRDAATSDLVVPLNVWTLVGVTFNSTATTNNLTYYVNSSSSIKTFNYDFQSGASSNVLGRRRAADANQEFIGLIDETYFWNRVLTTDETTELYNSGTGLEYPFLTSVCDEDPALRYGKLLLASKTRGIVLGGRSPGHYLFHPGTAAPTPPEPPAQDIDFYAMYDGSCTSGGDRYSDYECIINEMSAAYAYPLVQVSDYTNKIYIDPDYSGTESGSEAQPYNAWTDVGALQSGYAYLFKAGTTTTITGTLNTSVIAMIHIPNGINNVLLGAYGTGDMPIITPAGYATDGVHVLGDYLTISGIYLKGVNDTTIGGHMVRLRGSADFTTVYNCEISDSYVGLHSYAGTMTRVINTEIHNIYFDGMWFSEHDFVEIAHNYIYDVNTSFRYYQDEDCEDGTCSVGDGIQMQVVSAEQQWLHHNIIDRSAYGNKFGVIMGDNVGSYSATGPRTIFEFNTMYGTPNDIGDSDGSTLYIVSRGPTKIFRNIFIATQGTEDATIGIYHGAANDSVIGNVFVDYHWAIQSTSQASGSVYSHNTFYDNDVSLYSSGSTVNYRLYNNIFSVQSGDAFSSGITVTAEDQNMFEGISLPGTCPSSFVGSADFVNTTTNDFHLQSTSDAIGQGVTLGYWKFDRDEVTITGTPDVGAYEYVAP